MYQLIRCFDLAAQKINSQNISLGGKYSCLELTVVVNYFQNSLIGCDDPVKATKEKFQDNEDIFNEIIAVEEAKDSGGQARELVKKFGMACPMPGRLDDISG